MEKKGLKKWVMGLAALALIWAITGCKYVYEPGTYTPRDPIAERRSELRKVR